MGIVMVFIFYVYMGQRCKHMQKLYLIMKTLQMRIGLNIHGVQLCSQYDSS